MRSSVSKLATAIILSLVGSGCATVTAELDPLPLPPRPTLVHWQPGAIDCLNLDTAIIIKTNQIRLVGWGEMLEGVIKATHRND